MFDIYIYVFAIYVWCVHAVLLTYLPSGSACGQPTQHFPSSFAGGPKKGSIAIQPKKGQ